MYFLSALDPNYRIKGSRDPLGFQSLWASAGHKAVKHLSTVSSNLKDFMILCYGIHFYGERDPNGFIPFFLKLEELFAYARYIHNNETSFNGTEYISKRAHNTEFNLSLKDTILSNQRTYGIYGKYIRPMRDMRITNDPTFHSVIEDALSKTDRFAVMALVNRLLVENGQRVTITIDELIPFAKLVKTVSVEEKNLFREYILKVPGADHPQNNLYEVIRSNSEIVDQQFQLHQIIHSILACNETNDSLKYALTCISNTDKVLHPLNVVFTHILSKSCWSTDDLLKEDLFKALPGKVNYNFIDETMIRLNEMLGLPVVDLVKQVVIRNGEVSKQRGNKAWVEEDKKFLKVLYGENGRRITFLDNENGFEFPYFLNNYLGLFKQIESA
jgi:hypothetical protein